MKTLFHRIVLLTLVVSAIVIAVALATFLVYSGVVERETRHSKRSKKALLAHL